jgi:hypothetical protein
MEAQLGAKNEVSLEAPLRLSLQIEPLISGGLEVLRYLEIFHVH